MEYRRKLIFEIVGQSIIIGVSKKAYKKAYIWNSEVVNNNWVSKKAYIWNSEVVNNNWVSKKAYIWNSEAVNNNWVYLK